MDKKFSKPYNPQEVEEKIYKKWENSGYFNPDNLPGNRTEKFSMVLPPPNVTGTLHIGHALTITIEDILVRYQRMRGKKVLWLPGTDHASIATETKFLKEKKILRNDYVNNREQFIRLVNEFALQNQGTIIKQLRAMGASLDWSRIAFTLDKKRSLAVRTAFKKLWDAGLISRKERVINWDVKGQTGVSDDEIEYEVRKTILYTFRYSKNFPIPISTTRPETKVGDTAVAVHPKSKWKKYIGKEYKIENFAGVQLSIKIVGDELIDSSFGTGAVGVTPSHSKIDEEIADRHNLLRRQVINEYGRMNDHAGDIKKLKTDEARKQITQWLRENGLLEKEEEIEHNLALAQRSRGVIEPLPKRDQCFIEVNKPVYNRKNKTLKELIREPIANGKIKILPERFKKIYFHWIDNLQDWNISRQVWYGHQIPIWYCDNKKNQDCYKSRHDNPIVSIESPKKCPRCGGPNVYQELDTLDTWFSSALWTFSALGWPEENHELKTFHPTDVLETGYDILFFWIARMVLMSNFLLGEIPFHTIYLHGLVRDERRRKMSKSLGNVIDPLVMTEKYGTDALRLALIFNTVPGADSTMSEEKIKGMRNFVNKLWNVARFVFENTKDVNKNVEYTKEDKNIRNYFDKIVLKEVNKNIESYRLDLAAGTLYHYVWHKFADMIIEHSKTIFRDGTESEKDSRKKLLLLILEDSLKLLHPFMPFITEEIYSGLPDKKEQVLMIEKW